MSVPPALHELEAEIMEELWRLGESRVRTVMDVLNTSGERKRAYTTIMSTMARLYRKGLLDRRRVGTSDLYAPAWSREAYLDARARADVETLLGRHGDAALVHLAREMDRLDPERIERLRRLARGDDE